MILDAGYWMLVKQTEYISDSLTLDTGYWKLDHTINKRQRIMGGYRNLEIYQLAHDLGIKIHQFSLKLPRYELYETGDQLRRASKSISINIVEGYGRRRYKAELIKFLIYSIASCDETMECLCYIKDCYLEHDTQAKQLLSDTDELGRKINRFIQSVESSHLTNNSINNQVSSSK